MYFIMNINTHLSSESVKICNIIYVVIKLELISVVTAWCQNSLCIFKYSFINVWKIYLKHSVVPYKIIKSGYKALYDINFTLKDLCSFILLPIMPLSLSHASFKHFFSYDSLESMLVKASKISILFSLISMCSGVTCLTYTVKILKVNLEPCTMHDSSLLCERIVSRF